MTRLIRELRRRRVFRTGALYVVGSWLALQVADVLFPGFGIPDAAIQALVWTAILGFPIALVFGWFFDIGPGGIRRTLPAGAANQTSAPPLARSDYVILSAFAVVAGMLIYNATQDVLRIPAGPALEPSVDSDLAAPQLENSIAVLPFTNISSDPENDYFCDGVSEEILHELSGFRELNVIGRTSSFAFKGSDYGIPRISGLLGVEYVLQGSVRKQGAQLRIAAQLLDRKGVQVWSERFDRQLANIFEIQSEIAAAVAGNVATHLTARARPGHLPPVEAYEYFLQGRALQHQRESAKAVPLLLRAIEIDPTFAEAHAELAIASMTSDQSAQLPTPREAIDRALMLEPKLLRAQAAEGLWLLSQDSPDASGAERKLRAVLEQDPKSSDALLWLSNALILLGRDVESTEILERASRLDPLHPSIAANLARRLLASGEKDAAVRLLRRQLELPGVGDQAYFRYAVMLRQVGQLAGMNEIAKKMVMDGRPLGYPLLANSYRRFGNWTVSEYWFAHAARELTDFGFAVYFTSIRPPGKDDIALAEFRRVLTGTGKPLDEQEVDSRIWYGALLARTGEYREAIGILEPIIDPRGGPYHQGGQVELDGLHALAWSYLQTGDVDEAEQILAPAAASCRDLDVPNRSLDSDGIHRCAEIALLRGDRDTALSLLEQAVTVGWRDYYVREHDPYWAPLNDEPRYRELMARVKADVDREREKVQQRESDEAFIARFQSVHGGSTTNESGATRSGSKI